MTVAHKIRVGDIVHVRDKNEPWNHYHAKVSDLVGPHKIGVKRLGYSGFEHFTSWVWDEDVTVMTDKPMRDPHYEARIKLYKIIEEVSTAAGDAVRQAFDTADPDTQLTLTRADLVQAAVNALTQALDDQTQH